MSRFYIGQRAKKVRGRNNIGATGTVVCLGWNQQLEADMEVRIDHAGVAFSVALGVDVPVPAGAVRWTNTGMWEPIIPDGLESLEEINALYEPQGVPA